MEAHKYADIFPMIEGVAFEELKKDILANGLQQTIITYEGKILDGRNRFKACKELCLAPRFEEYKGDKPLEFVISLNLKRRHLNESQRGVVASKLATLEKGGNQYTASANLPTLTQEEASKMLNVSPRTIRTIKRIEREAPQKIKDIESGKIRADEVIKDLKIEARKELIQKQRETIKKGISNNLSNNYDVIVIDPPWDYGTDEHYNPDGFRGTCPYPVMTFEEIKNIQLPTSDNCVLWLWTTNKFILDMKELLNAWGFECKSVLTWDKEHFGIGRWLRSQTEHCILAIKGKPFFNNTKWSTLIKEKRTNHSAKPNIFYTMVDEICEGKKLDYFARKKRDGWDSYGDEV